MTLPPRLRPGHEVRIVSPSYPLLAKAPERGARAQRALEELGFVVTYGAHARARWGHLAGTPEERASDLNEAFADPNVRAVVCAFGGMATADILPLVDFGLLRADPKVVAGHSDNAALLLAISAETGLVTFHGLSFLSQFGEFPRPFAPTLEGFRSACMTPRPHELRPVGPRTVGVRVQSDPDLDRQERPLDLPGGWRWWREGAVTGTLTGAELTTLLVLADTRWFPSAAGVVLFWDAWGLNTDFVSWALHELELRGLLARCAGMVVGSSAAVNPSPYYAQLDDVLEERLRGFDGPVLVDADCGHTDPTWTLPIGVEATLDSQRDAFAVAAAVA
jgi:muramoyltetrapeptide carboxypeptidase